MNRISALILLITPFAAFSPSGASGQQIHPELTGEQLLEQLRRDYTPHTTLSYRGAREEMFSNIDNREGKVRLVYTGQEFETQGIPDHTVVNCEHTWPQSRFRDANGRNNMKSDLHHLFPTVSGANNDRGNKAFGEILDRDTIRWWGDFQSSNAIPTVDIDRYSESINSVFEPREVHKGNVARALFYFRATYGNRNIDTPWFRSQLDTLLGWNELDPVDEEERLRSVEIASLQGNENPFVLDPSLAVRAFSEVPRNRRDAVNLLSRAAPPGAIMMDGQQEGPERDGEQIRVVSWNVREIFSNRSVNRRSGQFNAFAQDLRPDILLIQEITAYQQVERIRDAMGLTGYYCACSDFNQNDTNQHSSFEVGVISRFPLTTISENDPSPDNGPGEPREFPLNRVDQEGIEDVRTSRGFLRVRIEDLKLILNVVHLKSANGNEGWHDRDNAKKREFVAAAVAEQVNRDRRFNDDYTIVVAGDFNVGETDSRKIGKNLIQDCYDEDCGGQDRYDDTHAILSEGLIGGLRMISKTKDLGMETYDSRNFEGSGPIDSFYVIGAEEQQFSAARRAMDTFGSDHFAVWSVLSRTQEPQ
ncbi:endonuclease [Verrucomicrobiales bacterium BCK34]|nr:endonuclease [Verrucomicrobiales bacterium BCK34]